MSIEIHFFEEYLKAKNLSKIKFIKHNSILFIACTSYKKFQKHKHIIKQKNPHITVGYWPVIKESYWLSAFAPIKEWKRILSEFTTIDKTTPILLDLELPIRIKPYLKNLFLLRRNKKQLKKTIQLVETRNLNMYYCQRPESNFLKIKSLEILGAGVSPQKHTKKILIMYYTSTIERWRGIKKRKKIQEKLKQTYDKYNNRLVLGLGTTAIGEMGNEPIITPENLKRDIRFAKEIGIKEAFIFRLGGHNKKYQQIIESEMK
ncbi:MAG: hypothetical protein ACQESC_02445 [Nanobdellota archaeon]